MQQHATTIRRTIMGALALGLTAAALTASVPVEAGPPAAAVRAPGNHQITHWTPDDGLDPPLQVGCSNPIQKIPVYEGQSTTTFPACGYPGVQGITVPAGQQYWCREHGSGQPFILFWTVGYHLWYNSTPYHADCVVQAA